MPRVRISSVLLLPALAASCALPRDPEKTSERISSRHELRVGVTDNPPWTSASHAEPQGIEPDLVRRFASKLGAHVVWTRASETQLVQALKHHELDVAVGGFDKKTQWSASAGVTQPFAEDANHKQHVFLAAPGENAFILTLDRFLTQQMRSSEGSA
jgi:ABC-type amino acid transport substrate-binding protein